MDKADAPTGEELKACAHGVRHPYPCDDCLDRDIPPGKRLADHPCYGISPIRPTEFSHRNSWPLSSVDHPYCSRCGTEIEGPNNRQKAGAPLCWEPRRTPADAPGQGDSLALCREVFLAGHWEGWTGNQCRRDVQHVDAEKGWTAYVSNGALAKARAAPRRHPAAAAASEPVAVTDQAVMLAAHILEDWDMKPRPNAHTGHSYEVIARDLLHRVAALSPVPVQGEGG